jgi:hypothetical protein
MAIGVPQPGGLLERLVRNPRVGDGRVGQQAADDEEFAPGGVGRVAGVVEADVAAFQGEEEDAGGVGLAGVGEMDALEGGIERGALALEFGDEAREDKAGEGGEIVLAGVELLGRGSAQDHARGELDRAFELVGASRQIDNAASFGKGIEGGLEFVVPGVALFGREIADGEPGEFGRPWKIKACERVVCGNRRGHTQQGKRD